MPGTILTQHQNIDHALLELDQLLDDWREPSRLSASIAAFAMILQAHFEHEERSYLFNGFVEDYPRFAHQLEALKEEHIEMMAEIRSISAELLELPREVVALRMRALMARLGLHESREIDLLQHAHTDDLAPGD
jgi:hypothetical protein